MAVELVLLPMGDVEGEVIVNQNAEAVFLERRVSKALVFGVRVVGYL